MAEQTDGNWAYEMTKPSELESAINFLKNCWWLLTVRGGILLIFLKLESYCYFAQQHQDRSWSDIWKDALSVPLVSLTIFSIIWVNQENQNSDLETNMNDS